MKMYGVSLDVLYLIKDIIDNHTMHSAHCEVDTNDTCNCGLAQKRERYIIACREMEEVPIRSGAARGERD
jgi:hypothetical protein